MKQISWNKDVRLILADVDQTVVYDFLAADPPMIRELELLLLEGHSIFFVTGGPFNRVCSRITDHLPAPLRHRVVVSHCSGAEVWGFDKDGEQHKEPFYSVYDQYVNSEQKRQWREIVEELAGEFHLEVDNEVTNVEDFRAKYGDNPFATTIEDRGPQITLEMINGYNLNPGQLEAVRAKLPHLEEIIDFREPIREWVNKRFQEQNVPVTARFGGLWALDLAIEGVSKAESVERVLSSPHIIQHIGMGKTDLSNPNHLEIWGDRFEQYHGTDWLMCKAVDPRIRAIDFRRENPDNFPPGYNIVLWQGKHEFQDGLLEYLQSRH